MLRGEDHGTEAGRTGGARPLAGVEPRRVEDRRILGAVSPLAVGERVHAEMEEHGQLVPLPGELRGGGAGALLGRQGGEPARADGAGGDAGGGGGKEGAASGHIAPRLGNRMPELPGIEPYL